MWRASRTTYISDAVFSMSCGYTEELWQTEMLPNFDSNFGQVTMNSLEIVRLSTHTEKPRNIICPET
jgi:hypothetical protein